ncbi:LuxR C-terminal-related transcriptional regulator [Pseudoduganella violacea]|uniref:Two-component system nitrate/nitrite response regulator NarL n=1 Tax=Pseudoduganella violacea TaxID=1715466 RepID=A0A7W5BEJ9_9BURK|nr:response regulator transcription factor [Pseudoduganella violacea]MBB3121697.1 two-component system nitrate/nitrite response regulator NarL [Pseudoduganella violacea]
MSKITVLCADAAVHTALQYTLSPCDEIELMDGVLQPEQQLLAFAHTQQPDLLLLDGDRDYIALLAAMRLVSPAARPIIFYDFCGHREVIEAITYGAKGCLQKTSDPAGWEKAIRLVYQGHIWLTRQLLEESLDWLLHHHDRQFLPEPKPKRITPREWEVLHWVSQGMTNKEVARQLDISDTTVKTHLQHVFKKLEIRRRQLLPLA